MSVIHTISKKISHGIRTLAGHTVKPGKGGFKAAQTQVGAALSTSIPGATASARSVRFGKPDEVRRYTPSAAPSELSPKPENVGKIVSQPIETEAEATAILPWTNRPDLDTQFKALSPHERDAFLACIADAENVREGLASQVFGRLDEGDSLETGMQNLIRGMHKSSQRIAREEAMKHRVAVEKTVAQPIEADQAAVGGATYDPWDFAPFLVINLGSQLQREHLDRLVYMGKQHELVAATRNKDEDAAIHGAKLAFLAIPTALIEKSHQEGAALAARMLRDYPGLKALLPPDGPISFGALKSALERLDD